MTRSFITVGRQKITKDLFRNIVRPFCNYLIKPSGGLWASTYCGEEEYICSWYSFLLEGHREEILYMDIYNGCRFTLKKDAKILEINSCEQFYELVKRYPSIHHILCYIKDYSRINQTLDFEALAQDYDGVFIDPYKLLEINSFQKWDVDTLLLFNLDCIESYERVKIETNIDPIDRGYDEYIYPYITEIYSPEKVEEHSIYYLELYGIMKNLFLEFLCKRNSRLSDDYNNYMSVLTEVASEVIATVRKAYPKLCENLYLINKDKEKRLTLNYIMVNMSLNIISEFFAKDKDQIVKLPKSRILTCREYKIKTSENVEE